jgi:hypothetical protein
MNKSIEVLINDGNSNNHIDYFFNKDIIYHLNNRNKPKFIIGRFVDKHRSRLIKLIEFGIHLDFYKK